MVLTNQSSVEMTIVLSQVRPNEEGLKRKLAAEKVSLASCTACNQLRIVFFATTFLRSPKHSHGIKVAMMWQFPLKMDSLRCRTRCCAVEPVIEEHTFREEVKPDSAFVVVAASKTLSNQ